MADVTLSVGPFFQPGAVLYVYQFASDDPDGRPPPVTPITAGTVAADNTITFEGLLDDKTYWVGPGSAPYKYLSVHTAPPQAGTLGVDQVARDLASTAANTGALAIEMAADAVKTGDPRLSPMRVIDLRAQGAEPRVEMRSTDVIVTVLLELRAATALTFSPIYGPSTIFIRVTNPGGHTLSIAQLNGASPAIGEHTVLMLACPDGSDLFPMLGYQAGSITAISVVPSTVQVGA